MFKSGYISRPSVFSLARPLNMLTYPHTVFQRYTHTTTHFNDKADKICIYDVYDYAAVPSFIRNIYNIIEISPVASLPLTTSSHPQHQSLSPPSSLLSQPISCHTLYLLYLHAFLLPVTPPIVIPPRNALSTPCRPQPRHLFLYLLPFIIITPPHTPPHTTHALSFSPCTLHFSTLAPHPLS